MAGENRTCPRCGIEFVAKRSNQIHCSRLCQQRASASRNYKQNKQDPEYRAKRRKTFLEWVNRNKDRYSVLQKVYQMRKEQKEFKPIGIKYVTQE